LPRLNQPSTDLGAVNANPFFEKKIPAKRVPLKGSVASGSKLEGDLHKSLKIELLKRQSHPLKEELREAAFLMDAMLRAVENGREELSPRSKQRIYGKQPNLAEALRHARHQQERDMLREQEQLLRQRDARLKKQLVGYSQEKQCKKEEEVLEQQED
jgi:hypothetical protein